MIYFQGVQQSDFQQKLRENFLAAVNFPRNVEFFVAECNTFFDDQANFVKALLPTEVYSCLQVTICLYILLI